MSRPGQRSTANRVLDGMRSAVSTSSTHPAWCTNRLKHHEISECTGDIALVRGIDVGTKAVVWLTCEPGGQDWPVALVELVDGDAPAQSVYLDAAGLRQLASRLTELAGLLERSAE